MASVIMNEKDINNFRIISEKLARLIILWRATEAARGAAAALIALTVPTALAMAAGATGAPRAAVVFSALVVFFLAVVCLFVVPLVRPLTLKDIALLVERKHPSLSGKAVNCVELFSDAETGKAAFDLGRLSSLLEETAAEMSHFAYSEALNMPGMRKSLIALGAAGAVESIACLKMLQTGVLIPTINYETEDPECMGLDFVPNQVREKAIAVAMSNSFGFGGHNAVLVFRKFE